MICNRIESAHVISDEQCHAERWPWRFGYGPALVAAAKKHKRMCQVGTQCRSNAALLNAMKFIEDGGIGEVNFARGLCYKRRKSIGPLLWFDPEKEVFTDSAEANKILHREYRKPFVCPVPEDV